MICSQAYHTVHQTEVSTPALSTQLFKVNTRSFFSPSLSTVLFKCHWNPDALENTTQFVAVAVMQLLMCWNQTHGVCIMSHGGSFKHREPVAVFSSLPGSRLSSEASHELEREPQGLASSANWGRVPWPKPWLCHTLCMLTSSYFSPIRSVSGSDPTTHTSWCDLERVSHSQSRAGVSCWPDGNS